MITGKEGGFCHRMMPPTDWDYGPIPQECYNPNLSRREIMDLLRPIYLDPERVQKLADSDDPYEHFMTRSALEIIIEIDADFIWAYNLSH